MFLIRAEAEYAPTLMINFTLSVGVHSELGIVILDPEYAIKSPLECDLYVEKERRYINVSRVSLSEKLIPIDDFCQQTGISKDTLREAYTNVCRAYILSTDIKRPCQQVDDGEYEPSDGKRGFDPNSGQHNSNVDIIDNGRGRKT